MHSQQLAAKTAQAKDGIKSNAQALADRFGIKQDLIDALDPSGRAPSEVKALWQIQAIDDFLSALVVAINEPAPEPEPEPKKARVKKSEG